MRKKNYGAVLFAIFFITAAAIAPSAEAAPGPGIEARIARQQQRINQGIASGALTKHETDILQSNLDRIKVMASNMRARSGGVLRPMQRTRLNHMLDRNSSMIFYKKHNPVRRF